MTIKEFSEKQRKDKDFWKTFVPEDVLNKERSLRSWFMQEFECSASSFMHFRDRILHLSDSFNLWHNTQEQRALSNLERFGADSPNRRTFESWKTLIRENNENVELVELPESSRKSFKCKCLLCGKEFSTVLLIGGHSWGTVRKCPSCFGNRTRLEKRIEDYIKSKGFEAFHQNRAPQFKGTELENKEIDIVVPELNIAFEVNGALTHNSEWNPFSDKLKESTYHKKKTEILLSRGLRLYHLWEHWDTEKILDFVDTKLGVSNTKIGARKTVLKQITAEEARLFLDKYHIHGFFSASYYFGLSYKDELVLVLTVRRIENSFEISRLATKHGVVVQGGFSKILRKVEEVAKTEGVSSIRSYAYRDLTPDYVDSIYLKTGFRFIKYTSPSLFYYNRHKVVKNGLCVLPGVHSRLKFQAHVLKKYNICVSELKSIGLYRLYDSGNLLFEKKL